MEALVIRGPGRSRGSVRIVLSSEETTERVRLLSLVDIFEPLSEEEIERLNGQLSDVHLEPGEIFYTPQDRSERLFVLWKGRVRIYRTTDGREFTLATVEAGTVFGEMALTAQQMQGAYAQAMESSELSVMQRVDLERLMLDKPEVGLTDIPSALRASQALRDPSGGHHSQGRPGTPGVPHPLAHRQRGCGDPLEPA
jgi:CRP-like cAMP-binding protein